MKRAMPVLLLLMAVLSACGSTPSASLPGTGAPSTGQMTGPIETVTPAPLGSALPEPWVTAAVLNSAGNSAATASFKFTGAGGTGLMAQGLSVSVESAPAGLSVQPLAVRSGPDGLTLPVTVQASVSGQGGNAQDHAAQTDIWLSIRASGQVQRLRVPVAWASGTALPTGSVPGSSAQIAATLPCGTDVWLSSPVNAPAEQRARLLRLNTLTSAVQSYALNLASTEGVTSLVCAPSGEVWLTIRSDDAQGSVIARYQPQSGVLTRFPVDASGDTLNNLTRTPDGRLWFVQYKRDRLGEFDPQTGRVVSHAVAENAENLRLGQDGALYYSQFYTSPAVVRYDPASGGSTVMSVGAGGKNLPRASVQVGGAVWYVDAWTQTLTRLDQATRQATLARLPAGATPGELVATQAGTLWLADAARHVLYRVSAGSLDAVTVPLLGSGPEGIGTDGPRALSVDDSGRLWYESGGQLVRQE